MPHDELCFDLVDGIHGHADDNQQGCAAKIEVHAQTFQNEPGRNAVDPVAQQGQVIQLDPGDHNVRNQAQDRQVNTSHHGNLGQDIVHVIGRIAAGTNARNETAVLTHVVGGLIGIENDGNVEETEENDARHEQAVVERFAVLDAFQRGREPADVLDPAHLRQGLREGQNRGSEDYRNHAAGVDFERHMGRLPAHHAAAHHALGVLHRNPALAALHQDDEGYHRDHHADQHDQRDGAPVVDGEHVLIDVGDGVGQPHHDAGENDQRHAVADASLANLLAQPHDERRAGGQRNDGQKNKTDARVDHDALLHRLQALRDAERLENREDDGQVASPLRDLAAAQFAFLLQLFQGGDHHGEQLQNDRRRNVRHDP